MRTSTAQRTLPTDWPFDDTIRSPRRFIRQQSDGEPGVDGDGDKAKDLAYWQGEAKRAFKARDEVKARLKEFEGRVLSDQDRQLFDRLKTEQADLEERRKRAEGQFDVLKQELVTKHEKEIRAKDEELQSVRREFEEDRIRSAFFGATEWFGGDTARTILDAEIGYDAFKKYCRLEAVDLGNGTVVKQIVVRKPTGEVIHGRDGNPAPFTLAIGELIQALPNRDRVLRGSGKAGSGSEGGTGGGARGEPDLDELLMRARVGDKQAIADLKARERRVGAGGLQIGRV